MIRKKPAEGNRCCQRPLRLLLIPLALLLVGNGCGEEELPAPDRPSLTLEDLAVPVRMTERTFLLSDRAGAFLHGSAGGGGPVELIWTVGGSEIVERLRIAIGGRALDTSLARSLIVSPDRFLARGDAGWEIAVAPVEGMDRDRHAIGLRFLGLKGERVEVAFRLSKERKDGRSRFSLMASPGSHIRGTRVLAEGMDSLDVVAILSGAQQPQAGVSVEGGLDRPFRTRRARMDSLLQRSYLRMSDPLLMRATAWFKLAIDALVVDGSEVSLAGGWPWDGTFSGRENLRSIPGGALVTGELRLAGRLLDAWGARMDRRTGGPTCGRIPGRVGRGGNTYDAIDVSGSFARALYDYVVASGDTARARDLFPVVRAGIEGMRKHDLGSDTLIHHGAGETWMGRERFRDFPGPYTAVEIQSLWQTQQIIAAIISQHLRDTAAARDFARGGVDAGVRFSSAFVDTSRRLLYDCLDVRGVPHDQLTAGGLLAMESIDGELILSSLTRRSVNGLLTPFGPRGLLRGKIATWLTGPFVYALSRSDRQDLAGRVTANLAAYALEQGMVGMLPSGFSADSGSGGGFRPEGPEASLVGMSEFVRLVYQDYLGIRTDVPSAVVRFEPKLPPGLDSADATVYFGTTPLRALYARGRETCRMTIELGDAPRPVKWRFIWTFENGDGWMGAARVEPGTSMTAVFAPGEMLLYAGGEERVPDEKWFIRGLSQRGSNLDLEIGGPAQ